MLVDVLERGDGTLVLVASKRSEMRPASSWGAATPIGELHLGTELSPTVMNALRSRGCHPVVGRDAEYFWRSMLPAVSSPEELSVGVPGQVVPILIG